MYVTNFTTIDYDNITEHDNFLNNVQTMKIILI